MHLTMQVTARPGNRRKSRQRRVWIAGLCMLVIVADAQAQGKSKQYVQFDSNMLLRGVSDDSVDLSRFEKPNAVLPGQYRVDVLVNGNWRGASFVEFRDVGQDGAAPCYTAELLRSSGFDMEKLERQAAEQGRPALGDTPYCGDLATHVPGAQARFDAAEQQLLLTVPTIYLGTRRASIYVDPALSDSGITAARLGYTGNYYSQYVRGGRSDDRGYLGLSAGLNVASWRVRHDGSVAWGSREGSRYQRGRLYAVTGIPSWKSELLLGETSSDGRYFDPVSFRGVRVASDERMLPDERRNYVPTIRGTAQTNATVSVYQRGFLVHETTVAAGPFVIEDLQAASYGGDLEVRVVEANGETRRFTVPFATTVELLKSGETRYSMSLGQAMASGYRSGGPAVFEGLVRRGLSNLVTAYGGLALSGNYRSVLLGAVLNTEWGALAGDITAATAKLANEKSSGSSYRLSYSKNLPETGTNFSVLAYRYSTSGFVGFNEAVAQRNIPKSDRYYDAGGRLRNRIDVNINQSLGDRLGSFYLNGSAIQYWKRAGRNINFGGGYYNNWGRVSYALNVQRSTVNGGLYSLGRERETTVTLNLNIPLGKSYDAPLLNSYTSHSGAGGTNSGLSVGGSAGEDSLFNYSLGTSYNSRSGMSSANGNLDYLGSLAQVGASISQGRDYRQTSLRASGNVLAHAGGVTLAPVLGDTIGLLHAPDAKDARTTRDRNSRIDGRGYGLVPYLMPYRSNNVELDSADMADDVELLSNMRTVAPRAGAVVLLSYPTRRSRPVLVDGKQRDGAPLPFGAEVYDLEDGEVIGSVGQGSRIVMRVRKDEGRVSVRWGSKADQRCRIDYALSERERGQSGFDVVESVCQPEPASPAGPMPVAGLKP